MVERIVYFGTPEFAVPPLEAMVAAGREPVLVVTQPARRQGRGMKLRPSPVAAAADRGGLPLAEAASVRDETFMQQLSEVEPDLAVVAAFGQIFNQQLLDLPRLGCLNIHASLLPAYRGAAPIQAAIAAGESETGVSMMWMERGLDSGPVVGQRSLAIGGDETAPELRERLSSAGAELLITTLTELDEGQVSGIPQDETQASYAGRLSRDDGRVDWSRPASTIYDRWRAYQPWPGVWIEHAGELIKLVEVAAQDLAADAAAGCLVELASEVIVVACGVGALQVRRAQRPGRSVVSGRELAAGLGLEVGDRLGSTPTVAG